MHLVELEHKRSLAFQRLKRRCEFNHRLHHKLLDALGLLGRKHTPCPLDSPIEDRQCEALCAQRERG